MYSHLTLFCSNFSSIVSFSTVSNKFKRTGKTYLVKEKFSLDSRTFVVGNFLNFTYPPPLKLVERVAYPSPPALQYQFNTLFILYYFLTVKLYKFRPEIRSFTLISGNIILGGSFGWVFFSRSSVGNSMFPQRWLNSE